jgi:CheY-like chemotaxis protein
MAWCDHGVTAGQASRLLLARKRMGTHGNDHDVFRERVGSHLTRRFPSIEHGVVVAKNGREALAILDTAFAGFGCVLMDVQMPEMDGFECTAIIRQREQKTGSRLPIVAMTAHAMKGDEARCLAAGMDAYLSKPIDPDELFDVVERHLGVSSFPVSRPMSSPP